MIAVRVAQQLAGASVGLLTGLLTARWLGPEGKGLLAVVLLVSGVASQIATMGLHDAASFLRRRRGFAVASMLRLFDRFILGAGLAAGVVVAAAGYAFGETLWSQALPFALAVATGMLAASRLSALLYKGLLQADERFALIAALDFCDALLPGILWCAGALLLGPSVMLAAVSFLASAVIVSVAARLRLARAAGADVPAAAPSLAAEMTQYGSKTYLRQIAMMAMARGDVFLVGHLLGVAGVGIYSVAVTLAEVITRFPDAIGWILMPRSAALVDDAARHKSARYARMSLLVAAIAAVPFFVAASVLVALALPVSFQAVPGVLAWLLPGVVASCITRVLGADLVGRGHAAMVANITWLTVALLAIADLLLIPRLGLRGAAIGSSAAQIAAALIMAVAYGREAGLQVRALLFVKGEDLVLTGNGLLTAALRGRVLGREASRS